MTVEVWRSDHIYAAPSGAHLTYNGGPLMSHPKLVGIFFDNLDGSAYPFVSQLEGYLKWFVTSDALKELQEYQAGGSVFFPGSYSGTFLASLTSQQPVPPPPVPSPPPTPPPTSCDAALQSYLDCIGYTAQTHALIRLVSKKHHGGSLTLQDSDVQALLTKISGLPIPDGDTLYCMFFPDGVTVDLPPSDASCTTFCGYHSQFMRGNNSVQYAVLPYPSCTGCLGTLQALDALTSVISHEISEAITDPIPGQGWYDQNNGEIGDICAWVTRQDGLYVVQQEWSNKRGSCI